MDIRVKEIGSYKSQNDWRFVPGNIADLPSHGCNEKTLIEI